MDKNLWQGLRQILDVFNLSRRKPKNKKEEQFLDNAGVKFRGEGPNAPHDEYSILTRRSHADE